MRPVVIVFLDPAGDVAPRFFQAAILRRPDFLFLQAAMEPFDVTVALRVMISGAAVRDAELSERSKNRDEVNCVPLSVVGVRLRGSLRVVVSSTACSTAVSASSVRH